MKKIVLAAMLALMSIGAMAAEKVVVVHSGQEQEARRHAEERRQLELKHHAMVKHEKVVVVKKH